MAYIMTGGILSGSTDGRGILVVATATAGTLIHTVTAGQTNYEAVILYAVNPHTAAIKLSLEWGGVTSPGDLITITIPIDSGLFLVTPGLRLRNGLVIRAFAAVASKITIFGHTDIRSTA